MKKKILHISHHIGTEEESNHLSIGYIPCRTFKNISYGQLGVTNSRAVKDLFSRNGIELIHRDNVDELLSAAECHLRNYDVIESQMEYVKNNHTYINRINCLIKCI